LEKNKDPLNDTAVNVLKNSQNNKLILDIWRDYTTQEETAAEEKKTGKQVGFFF
jgi:myosin protein heavy chain